MGASFHSQVLPWSSMERTIGVSRATWPASRNTSQTASRANGTTAVERLEAEKTVMGSIVGHGRSARVAGRYPATSGAGSVPEGRLGA